MFQFRREESRLTRHRFKEALRRSNDDRFRAFVQSENFRELFDLDRDEPNAILQSDDKLLLVAMRFLRQVLIGEHSIRLKPGARERRIVERREAWEG